MTQEEINYKNCQQLKKKKRKKEAFRKERTNALMVLYAPSNKQQVNFKPVPLLQRTEKIRKSTHFMRLPNFNN